MKLPESTLKILTEIAKDLVVLARVILDDDSISKNTKINKNTLKGSKLEKEIESNIKLEDDNALIETLFLPYIRFLEWDRPPKYGKQPPTEVLRDWALSKNIPTDNSTLFLIARAIWQQGHKGRPIIATLSDQAETAIDDKTFDNLYNSIIEDLTNYFNQ